jgi:hypothetical protein
MSLITSENPQLSTRQCGSRPSRPDLTADDVGWEIIDGISELNGACLNTLALVYRALLEASRQDGPP